MSGRMQDEELIRAAVEKVRQTRSVVVERGARHHAAAVFEQLFGQVSALVIADVNTLAAAGHGILDSFHSAGHSYVAPLVFEEPRLRADFDHVQTIEQTLRKQNAVAVAVGSGTINDLTKLAAQNAGRPYLAVATAASMDGYAAFGASITRDGSKQTFPCAAPAGILADLEIIEAAPRSLNAAGYADLMAKTVAGADWLVSDSLRIEPIDATSWQMIHRRLRAWLDDPEGIRNGESDALRSLTIGLLMSGFAMQHAKTSRPASGAEHQFSHLWDMRRSADCREAPSHGFQVAIGTLASSGLYEQLLLRDLADLDVDCLSSRWNELPAVEAEICRRFSHPAIRNKALEETRAKHPTTQALHDQLVHLRIVWPRLRSRLQSHLVPRSEIRDRLAAAGCPCRPQEIGISPERLREDHGLAYHIRRRFTVLDLAVRTGLLEPLLQSIEFGG